MAGFRDQLEYEIGKAIGVKVGPPPFIPATNPDGSIPVVIDADDAAAALRNLFSEFPEIVDDLLTLFFGEGARFKPCLAVDYLFVVADCPTANGHANYQILALRFRNADERKAARAALL